MTREEGQKLVEEYDSNEPESLDYYCDFMWISKDHFYDLVAPMRDPDIWEIKSGEWVTKDAVWKHQTDEAIEAARPQPSKDHTFSPKNRNLYYNPELPPEPLGDLALDVKSPQFQVM